MQDDRDAARRVWKIILVLLRVFLVLGVTLILFLGIFLGYFSIPMIVIVIGLLVLIIRQEYYLWHKRKNR